MFKKPLILLAFANERQPGATYLRNLPIELNQLRAALEKAKDAGLCDYEILTNVTLEQLFSTFRNKRNRGRIAIFHYSGHAESFELLLEDEKGQTAKAHAAGLVPFLASQNGLEMVFLNGCHSLSTSKQLLDQGVPVVVGTVQAINDKTATDLSTFFYRSLAEGLPIGQSWNAAVQQLQAGNQDVEGWYNEAAIHRGGLKLNVDRFPWEMRFRPGSEEVKNWSLPAASNNPTFGLPKIPENYPLPDDPYLFLRRYEQQDAAIFFGRGNYVRELYRRLTNPSSASVVMLYGQSGVGKSSLLGAGLIPRLEKNYEIIYVRRDPMTGLSGGLKKALGMPLNTGVSQKQKAAERQKILDNIQQYESLVANLTGDAKTDAEQTIEKYQSQLEALHQPELPDLAGAWKQKEIDRPLILILDQVEEVFTRIKTDEPNELKDFCLLVKSIFDTPQKRPKGKLLLSYRKDFDSEILAALKAHRIERERVFLDKIGRAEIIEIANGLTSTQRLRDRYQIEVENGLDVEIADDLIVDPDSPIAPVLQIILTKLWQQVEKEERRVFTKENYRQLRKDGILLGDFFHQQMDVLKAWEQVIERQVESSGLALDMLNYHTTPLGTARSNELKDLQEKYQHQEDILDDLIARFKELYLLSGVGTDKVSLAHDTLAPIIQQEIRQSNRPGQRALRILENKAADYKRNPNETIIEEDDLALVESGEAGMRKWTLQETTLVTKSRERRDQLQAERSRNRWHKRVATILVGLFAVVATLFWRQSVQSKAQIEIDLLYNEGRLEANDDPTMGMVKMKEALERNKKADKELIIKGGIHDVFANNVFYEIIHTEQNGQLVHVAFDKSGNSFATSLDSDYNLHFYKKDENASTAGNWQLTTDNLQLVGPKHPINELSFVNNHLIAVADDETVYRWPKSGGEPITYGGHPGEGEDAVGLVALAISTDAQTLCTVEEGVPAKVLCWNVATGAAAGVFAIEEEVAKAVFLPDGDLLVGLKNGWIRKYELIGNLKGKWQHRKAEITAMALSNNGKWVAVGYKDNLALLWKDLGELDSRNNVVRLDNGSIEFNIGTTKSDSLQDHTGAINQVAFSNDNRLLLTSSDDHTAKVWTVADYRLRYTLKGHTGPVVNAVFTNDDQTILTASEDNTIRQWAFSYPFRQGVLETDGKRLEGLAFTEGGNKLVALDRGGSLFEWSVREADFKLVKKSEKKKMEDIPKQNSTIDENGYVTATSPDGSFTVRHGLEGDCFIRIYSPEGFLMKKFMALPGQKKNCNKPLIAIHPNGELILTADINGRVFIWGND